MHIKSLEYKDLLIDYAIETGGNRHGTQCCRAELIIPRR